MGRIRCPEFECMVRINAEGFRDPERNASAASGRKRVAVLGDSIAWGWGVQDDERFSAVLEHEFFTRM
ncbi:MAG: hypothetical protein R3E96_00160 [Planctomycetota bacterium]